MPRWLWRKQGANGVPLLTAGEFCSSKAVFVVAIAKLMTLQNGQHTACQLHSFGQAHNATHRCQQWHGLLGKEEPDRQKLHDLLRWFDSCIKRWVRTTAPRRVAPPGC